jgi:23S rRNA (guanosine2251-2'-O)-methyltransferase
MLYCYGKNPLHEALKKHVKTPCIEKLFITKQALLEKDIASAIDRYKLPYTVVTREEIEHQVGKSSVHQGVMFTVHEKSLFVPLDTLLVALEKKERPLLVLLDALEDPHNIGAIIRSALAFGADGIILSHRHTGSLTGTSVKASAGALFHIPLAEVVNTNATLIALKKRRFWIYALVGGGDTSLTKVAFDSPSVLVVGNEGEGIGKKTLEHSDFRLSIPITKECESLNASNATAVALYEWRRQNNAI